MEEIPEEVVKEANRIVFRLMVKEGKVETCSRCVNEVGKYEEVDVC